MSIWPILLAFALYLHLSFILPIHDLHPTASSERTLCHSASRIQHTRTHPRAVVRQIFKVEIHPLLSHRLTHHLTHTHTPPPSLIRNRKVWSPIFPPHLVYSSFPPSLFLGSGFHQVLISIQHFTFTPFSLPLLRRTTRRLKHSSHTIHLQRSIAQRSSSNNSPHIPRNAPHTGERRVARTFSNSSRSHSTLLGSLSAFHHFRPPPATATVVSRSSCYIHSRPVFPFRHQPPGPLPLTGPCTANNLAAVVQQLSTVQVRGQ